MGIAPGNDVHGMSVSHQSVLNEQPVWLGGAGQDTIPFTSVMSQVTSRVKSDNVSYLPNATVDKIVPKSNPSTTQTPLEKFEKIVATLDYDEIKTLRKIKIDAIKDAMHCGNEDMLHQAQAEFKACSQELRLRASTLGLAPQSGISVNSVEQQGALAGETTAAAQSVTSITDKQPAKLMELPLFSSNLNPPGKILPGSVNNNIGGEPLMINKNANIVSANITPPNISYPTGNNRFGVSPVVWEAVQKNDFVKNTLLTFPLEAVDMYKTTPFEEKRLLFEQLQEKTKVMFITVDHKEAFINGSAYGHNAFDFFKSKIEEELKSGKLSQDVAGKRMEKVELFRGMSQEQRKAFVDLLEIDMRTAKI